MGSLPHSLPPIILHQALEALLHSHHNQYASAGSLTCEILLLTGLLVTFS